MMRCVMDSWALGVSAIALVIAVTTASLSFRGTPQNLVRAARSGAQELALISDRIVALEGRWAARSKEYEALHEAIMDDVERAEKKRRQASAAAARSAHNTPEAVDLTDMSTLRKLALQRGLL